MPIFEYKCPQCETVFEHMAASSQDPAPPCPECGALESRKQLSRFSAKPGQGGSRGRGSGSYKPPT